MIEKPAHPVYVTVWIAFSAQGVIGPYFFENSDGKRETVRQENYRKMVDTSFVPKLRELFSDDFENQILTRDGVSPHTAKTTLDLLKKYFD